MIGIAICTYRRPAGLRRLMTALPSGCHGVAERVLVIVVDNDGHDPEVESAVRPSSTALDVRLVVEPRPGISAARNRAIAEAEAAGVSLLAMIDDDEYPDTGWLAAMLARQRETGAAVVGGRIEPDFGGQPSVPGHLRPFWSVRPQTRDGRPFVHTTGNVLLDLRQLRTIERPWFDDRFGLSGGGDLVFFSRLFQLGMPMAWMEAGLVKEAVPADRARWSWLRRRRFRVGNHMVVDETIRQGRLRPVAKTVGLLLRLPVYPALNREPGAVAAGWLLEGLKIGGRLAAHCGWHVVEYARDGRGLLSITDRSRNTDLRPWSEVDPKDVVVGVPALNEAPHIEACVRSLLRGDWMRGTTVAVADGGSDDATVEIVHRLCHEFPNLRLVPNPRRSQAAALNLIAARASPHHRYLVRCDAHATYPEGFVRTAVETLAGHRPDVAAVTSVLDASGSGSFARAAAWIVGTPLGSGFSAHRGGLRSGFVDHGHHAAFRLDWFRSVGGYDDRFAVNEDAELDHRLRAAGGRIWLEATLRVQYRMRETIGALARQYYAYGLWRARNLLLHRSRPRFRQVLPVGILIAVSGSLAAAVLVPGLLILPASYLLVIGLAGASCAIATKTATGLWAGPALAVIHNAWALGFIVAALQWLYRRSARIPAERAASNRTVATPGE